MTAPIATSAELALYLAEDAIVEDRADLILQLAQDLCETVVNPLPSLGKPVLLAVAARAYNNITAAHRVTIGTAEVSYGTQYSQTGIGGLFLAREEKRTLRRLAGRGGAFMIDMMPLAVPPTVTPDIDFLQPSGAAAGELVSIHGAGFTGTVAVSFGGVPAAQWVEVSDTELVATLPVGDSGLVLVTVSNAVGASSPVSYERG